MKTSGYIYIYPDSEQMDFGQLNMPERWLPSEPNYWSIFANFRHFCYQKPWPYLVGNSKREERTPTSVNANVSTSEERPLTPSVLNLPDLAMSQVMPGTYPMPSTIEANVQSTELTSRDRSVMVRETLFLVEALRRLPKTRRGKKIYQRWNPLSKQTLRWFFAYHL